MIIGRTSAVQSDIAPIGSLLQSAALGVDVIQPLSERVEPLGCKVLRKPLVCR